MCGMRVATPEHTWDVHSSEGCRGGRCSCGAAYVLDETGSRGGQALLDVLTLLCDGGLDRAMSLDSGVDYETKPLPYVRSAASEASGWRVTPSRQPKIWFARLKSDDA